MSEHSSGRRPNISQAITRRILQEILQGLYKPGDRLPPERDLAVRFETNRNTLREAIRNLQTLHVVEARHGDGLRVVDWLEEGELNLLPAYLRHGADGEERLAVLKDMLRLRRMLLAEACAVVAERAAPAELAELDALVAEQRGQEGESEAMMLTDLVIALTLVQASGSLAYRWIFNSLAKLFHEVAYIWPMLWVYPDNYVGSLSETMDAVRSGDPEAARRAMDEHLAQSDDLILDAYRAVSDTEEERP